MARGSNLIPPWQGDLKVKRSLKRMMTLKCCILMRKVPQTHCEFNYHALLKDSDRHGTGWCN